MIVCFTTTRGVRYAIDLTRRLWKRSPGPNPSVNRGRLYNNPIVRKGEHVEIWTQSTNPAMAARIIVTGPVKDLEIVNGPNTQ